MLFSVIYKKKVYPVYSVQLMGAVGGIANFLLWDSDKEKWFKVSCDQCKPV